MDVSNDRIVQNIFRCYAPSLRQQRRPLKDIKAIDAITDCRTEAMGVSYYACPEGHDAKAQVHSCRHRSCTLCAARNRRQWVEEQGRRLLDCAHFHVVFTMPHEYLGLWCFNQAWFSQALFSVCRDVLLELMADTRYHGVVPGIVMALHTWGRQLNLHPHMHCLLTGGGLTADREWQETGSFLLPIRVVKALYRGKFQARIKAAYDAGELQLPPDMTPEKFEAQHKAAYRKEWSVRIEEQYAHGKGVMLYLSRYLKGGPLNPKQVVYCGCDAIKFSYKDHRDQRQKVLSLTPGEFLRRLLLHVPVPGVHMVRHYGLYASASRDKRNQCREKLGGLLESVGPIAIEEHVKVVRSCRVCGQSMRHLNSLYRKREKGNSYKETTVPSNLVQQDDEAVIAYGARGRDPCKLVN